MKTPKEKAIALVLIGLAIQFIPLFIIGLLFLSFNVKNSPPNLLLSFLILDLFLLGYIFFIKGCCLYAKSKGYSSKWGSIGLLSVFSLPILLFLPPKKNSFSLQLEKLPSNPFEKINIPEDSLTIFIAMPVLLYFANNSSLIKTKLFGTEILTKYGLSHCLDCKSTKDCITLY